MKIIYPNGSGGVAVIHPTGELPIEAVAFKDVPDGAPYLFVEDDDIPSDRTYREAWEADFSHPHGRGGEEPDEAALAFLAGLLTGVSP